jgi:RNA polymerase sigma-70 factor (ECF subfamily)
LEEQNSPKAGVVVREDGVDADLPEELRRRLPARDPDALAAFFDAYFDRVYGYVRRLVRDEHLAEDLTQDVFLHVHRAFESYDPGRSLRPWVFTIATNKLRDFWRSRQHRAAQTDESIEEGGSAEGLASGEARVDEDLSEQEMAERLRAAVDELPEGMRITVLLRAYEGMSFEAIGEVVGRTEVAVRKRYSRALEALRATLGPAWQIHTEGT